MFRAYIELFRLKPIGLILSMVLFAHLFALRETGLSFEWAPALLLLGSTGLANAAAFALNQYYEREGDAKMERTKNRPIPAGLIAPRTALWSGLILFFLALAIQYVGINENTALATFLCGGIYVWSYTPLKSRSSISTLVGSLPGALLPFIGWYSITQGLNLIIIWMAIMIFLWQIPHTFTIVFRYKNQFSAAEGKQLPFVLGEGASFRQTAWYTLINLPLIFIPVAFKVSGGLYISIALAVTILALVFVFRFYRKRDAQSAKQFFFYMLTYLPVLFVFMAYDKI